MGEHEIRAQVERELPGAEDGLEAYERHASGIIARLANAVNTLEPRAWFSLGPQDFQNNAVIGDVRG